MKNVKTADGKTVNAWKNMDVTTDENLTFVSYVEAPWQATLEENNSMSAFCAAHVSPTHTLNYEAGTTDNVHNMPSAQTTQQDGSATFTVSTKEPIRQGYNFTGWKIKNSSNTTVYQPGGAITVTGTTTLVAQWEVIPYQPVYVFVQTRHQLTEGKYEAMEVDAAAVARLGISYNRSKPWATIGVLQSDALPTNATKGQQATAEQWNAVLAAIKDNGNFSNLVQFNGDGYNGTKFNASKLSTETLNALKWGSLHYNNGTSLAYTADNVPGWKFDSYLDFVKVTFDYNGGIAPDGAPNSGDYAVGESIQLPTPTREGYTFKGWMANDKAAGTGSYAAKTDVTLKAQWEANQYDVTFDVNANGDKSAKVTPETKTVTFDAAYGELPTPTRDGYTFKGWYAVPKVTDNDKEVTAATVVTTAGPHTLYAHWEARKDTKYTVEHYQEKLDGTYELKETEKLTGTTDTTVNAVAKEYDHFTYDETVKGTKASGTVTGDGKLVLKLYYIRNSYTVTFQPNNGDAATTATVKYDDTVAKPTDPTKSGYTFGGWYTDKKCTKGNEFSFDTKITGDITLYAKWDIKRTGTNPDAKNPYIKDNTKKDDGKTVKSGDTFDAGIGLYVGMSLLSLTGSALVVTKKKRG